VRPGARGRDRAAAKKEYLSTQSDECVSEFNT